MEKIPLLALVLHSYPEAILVSVAGMILIGVKPKPGIALVYGIIQTATAYFVRQLPIATGMHLLLLILTSSVYLARLYRMPLRKSLSAVVLGILLLVIAETVVVTLLTSQTTLSPEIIMAPENALLRVLVALPQMLILAIAAYLGWRIRGGELYDYTSRGRIRFGRSMR